MYYQIPMSTEEINLVRLPEKDSSLLEHVLCPLAGTDS